MRRVFVLWSSIVFLSLGAFPQSRSTTHVTKARATAQTHPTLSESIHQIVARPEFKHSNFGIEFYDIASGRIIFALNADKLFVPGSTTKLLTEGTALAVLGPDYRFRTRVYRTGPINAEGALEGDLVLVAGGDPNLSGRVRPDDTLAFTNEDHSYAGSLPGTALPDDPLTVLKDLARQVADQGVKRVQGRVLIDDSLFVGDKPDPGTGVMISPIVVNDNIVDVTVTPGQTSGDATSILISPLQPYLTVINKTTTGGPDSDAILRFTADQTNPDGSHSATLEGSVPAGWQTALAAYKVKTPRRFAEFAFVVALSTAGIQAQVAPLEAPPDPKTLLPFYTPENLVAEHFSPPLKEEVKLTLKVSQNLHAAMMPYLLGALAGHESDNALQAGLKLEHDFLQKAGLDLTGASQVDGAGGHPGAVFTPDFMARYLAFISKQPYAKVFFDSLPIMGRDGTLAEVQDKSRAAGHVRAKTGTYVYYDVLNHNLLLLSKGLVGYVETRSGRKLAFAMFVNQVPLSSLDDVGEVGDLLAQIAGVAYEMGPR